MDLKIGDPIGDDFRVIVSLKTTTYAQVYRVKHRIEGDAANYEARVFFPSPSVDYIGGDPDIKAYRRRSIRRLKARAVLQTTTRDGLVAVVYRTGPIHDFKSSKGLASITEDPSSTVTASGTKFEYLKPAVDLSGSTDTVTLPRGKRFGEDDYDYSRSLLLLWLRSFIQTADSFCYSLARTWHLFHAWALQSELWYCYLALWAFVIDWSWFIGTPLPVVIPSVAISHILVNYFYFPG